MLGKDDVPEELQKALIDALHALAIFAHEKAEVSHIIIEVQHLSDACNHQSQTGILMGGGGMRIEVKPLDPSAVADEVLKAAITKAKEKQASSMPQTPKTPAAEDQLGGA